MDFVRTAVRSSGNTIQNLSSDYVLLRSVFFGRWCNRHLTLDSIKNQWRDYFVHRTSSSSIETLQNKLRSVAHPPWDNVTAYPVEPVSWEGNKYGRFETATYLFSRNDVIDYIYGCLKRSKGDIQTATEMINLKFKMSNNFPIFMAVVDIAFFRPELIHPDSRVPIGIGAVAFVNRLEQDPRLKHCQNHHEIFDYLIRAQRQYWPEARRRLQPIDCEYLCCECRKYLSYKNGTKLFKGKNIFIAGRSAMLEFDISLETIYNGSKLADRIAIIAGAPCSGKSSVISQLRKNGYTCHDETAELMIREGVEKGLTSIELRKDPVAWQMTLLQRDFDLFHKLLQNPCPSSSINESCAKEKLQFTDTSLIETVVFGRRAGIQIGPNVSHWIQNRWAKQVVVFFLLPLPKTKYQQTKIRQETEEVANILSKEIRLAYEEFGLDMHTVPPVPVKERVNIILTKLEVKKVVTSKL